MRTWNLTGLYKAQQDRPRRQSANHVKSKPISEWSAKQRVAYLTKKVNRLERELLQARQDYRSLVAHHNFNCTCTEIY